MKVIDLTPSNQHSLPEVKPSADLIIDLGAEFFGLTREILLSEEKTRDVADARRIIAREILQQVPKAKIEHVAVCLNKSRTGIFHGVNNISLYLKSDKSLQEKVHGFNKYLEMTAEL